MRLAVTIALLAAIGCGGTPHGGGTTTASGSASGGPTGGAGSASDGAGSGAGSAPAIAPDAPLTRADCAAVLGHIVDVGMAEQKKAMPPDQAPNDDDAAKARQRVIDAGTDDCLKMPRTMFDCAMKAQDAAAMRGCEQQP